MNSSVNEEQFINACSSMNEVVNVMNSVESSLSSIDIPSDLSCASTITDIKSKISGEVKSKINEYITTFKSLNASVSELINLENTALNAVDGLSPEIVKDTKGNAVAIKTVDGSIISLSSFKKIESTNGTYYEWAGGKSSGLNNSCDIYVPKVEKLKGATVYFTGLGGLGVDDNIRQFKAGNIKTNSIVIIPTDCYNLNSSGSTYTGLTKSKAQSIAKDVQNIAASFGADPNNLTLYGFSAGGAIASSMVNGNENGTFKSIVMASTKEGLGNITDPNIKVISLIGEAEKSNADAIKEAISKYKEDHLNDVEVYTIPNSESIPKVSHTFVTAAAAISNIFNGNNIFEYVGTIGEELVNV